MADHVISAEVLKSLQCLKCKSYPLGQVNQCSNGDLICVACYRTAEGVCFKCGSKYPSPPIRSALAEIILDTMGFDCLYKNGNQGCQAQMARSEKENHEKICKFRTVSVCSLLCLMCNCKSLNSWICCKIDYINWETAKQNFEERPLGYVDTTTGRVSIQLADFPNDAGTTRIAWDPILTKLLLANGSFIYSIFLAEFIPEDQDFKVKVFHVADLDRNPADDFQIYFCVPNNNLKYPGLNWTVSPMSYLESNKTAQLCCPVSTLQSNSYMKDSTLTIQMKLSKVSSVPISDNSTDTTTVTLKRVPPGVHLSPSYDGVGCCPSDSPVQFSPYYTPQFSVTPSVEPCTNQGPSGSKRPRTSLRSNGTEAGDESDRSSPTESSESVRDGRYSPCPPTPTPCYS